MQKSTRFQLTRDNTYHSPYVLFNKEGAPKLMYSGYWEAKDASYHASFCSEQFEPFLPISLHLPPGGGPVDIQITIKDLT